MNPVTRPLIPPLPPGPPLAQLVPRAVLWAAIRALFIALVLGVLLVALGGVTPAGAASRALVVAAWLAAALFVYRTLSTSRTLLSRAFALTAFAATFFGLAMLVIFFFQLGRDVVKYFETMPALVREGNERIQKQADEVMDHEAFAAREIRSVEEEMNEELSRASTAAERAAIRQDFDRIRQRKLADLKLTVAELKQSAHQLRDHTSSLALLGHFLTSGASNEVQDAGILPAILGSLYVSIITIVCAVPLGVGAAIFLEEYRQTGWLARVIQVNISNLAGVPSVVYGILGAYVFVEMIFKPLEMHYGSGRVAARNVLGGGLTLALLTLPVIIVSAQEAIRAVPVSIRHAALALGATRWQVIQHHVLPNALPGILTGTILALSRALGEAAPLVLFGALLYVNHNPSLLDRFTVLPMQIFNWTGRPDEAWKYNAALASLVLLAMLLSLNAAAIYVRYYLQRGVRR